MKAIMKFQAQSVGRGLKTCIRLFCLALIPASTLAQNGLSAAEEVVNEERWYQVELIIFARNHVPPSAQENWDRNAVLAYPPQWVELGDPKQPIKLNEQTSLFESGPTSFGSFDFQASESFFNQTGSSPAPSAPDSDTVIDDASSPQNPPATDNNGEQTNNVQRVDDSKQSNEADFESESSASLSNADEALSEPTVTWPDINQDAFYQLPKELLALNPLAHDLQRKREYRVLYHEGWRQPVADETEAKSVIVSGGKQYGEHTELEGSIMISVSRYLHFHSNLWFAEFTPNYGQTAENWSQLPDRPQVNIQPQFNREFNYRHDGSNTEARPVLITEYSKILQQPFLIDQLYTLKQRRRMRSGEIHYIDHPKLGIVVKVSPFEYTPTDTENPLEHEEQSEAVPLAP